MVDLYDVNKPKLEIQTIIKTSLPASDLILYQRIFMFVFGLIVVICAYSLKPGFGNGKTNIEANRYRSPEAISGDCGSSCFRDYWRAWNLFCIYICSWNDVQEN